MGALRCIGIGLGEVGEAMPKLEQMPEDHIYKAYGLYLLQREHRFVKRLNRAHTRRFMVTGLGSQASS